MPRYLLPLCLTLACGTPAVVDPADQPDEPVDDWDPGAARVHRLTRAQLLRSLESLVEVEVDATSWTLSDPVTAGFDNTEAGLTLPPGFLPSWYGVLRGSIATAAFPGDHVRRFSPVELDALDRLTATAPVTLTPDGDYPYQGNLGESLDLPFYLPTAMPLKLQLDCTNQAPIPRLEFLLSIDSAVVPLSFTVDPENCVLTGTTAALAAGHHTLSLTEPLEEPLLIQQVSVEPAQPSSEEPNPLFSPCGDEACTRRVLTPILRRAWRAPVDDADLDALISLIAQAQAQGESYGSAVGLALESILLSPRFLFRTEVDTGGPLTDHELASRLSFLLWSQVPDLDLLDLADAGELSKPEILRAQVQRMLADHRAAGMVDDLLGQWLGFRDVHELASLAWVDSALQEAMAAESHALAARLVSAELTLDAAFTATLARPEGALADHYGTPTDLSTTGRVGPLGHASWLAFTSQATRTSPVRRGAAVLGRLLCDAPDPPPAGVDTTPPDVSPQDASQARRANPICAGCHAVLDPAGMALERFDEQGAYRERYRDGSVVDTLSLLDDGTRLSTVPELAAWVAADPRLAACFVENVTTWAYGRRLEDGHPVRTQATQALQASGLSMPALIEAIVLDRHFQRPVGAL